jgi:dephospho-CoA kinase
MNSLLAENKRLFLIGITGSMGCGKSTVTKLFAQSGARVLDADQMARAVVKPGQVGWQEVVDAFGDGILSDEAVPRTLRALDRKKLAELIFSDPDKRQILESIIHPKIAAIREETLREWELELATGGERVVVMEVPLLFETGIDKRCDLTLTVTCGEKQWQRLDERKGMSDAIKHAAIARQFSEAEKKTRADRIVDNSGRLEDTATQVKMLWQEFAA